MPGQGQVIDPNDPNSPIIQDLFTAETLTTSIDYQLGNPVLPGSIKFDIKSWAGNSGNYTSAKTYMMVNVYGTQLDLGYFIYQGSNATFFTTLNFYYNESVYLNFNNFLNDLTQGNYFVEVTFTLYGVKNGIETYINSAFSSFDLNITGMPDNISTDKNIYNLIFNRETNVLSGDQNVSIIGNVNNVALRLFTDINIFKPLDPIVNDAFVLEEGVGNPILTNPNLPLQGKVQLNAAIYKKMQGVPDIKVKAFTINIVVLNGDLLVDPANMTFSLLQSAAEVKQDILSIYNPYNKNFTIEGPMWLEFSTLSGNQTTDIIVSTLNSMNIPVGDYNDNILIKYDNTTLTIPVSMSVISYIYLSGMETYNFCLDNKILNFIKRTDTARFIKAVLTLKFVNEAESKIMSVPITIPYYNDRASFDLGSKIHQYFMRLKKSVLDEVKKPGIFDNKLWMKPAEVTIAVQELDVDYNVVHTENVGQILFYPGKKPLAFPLLSNHLVKQRVEGSKYIFAYIEGEIVPSKIGFGIPNSLDLGVISRVKIEDDENKIVFPKKKIFQITDTKQLIYYTIPNNGSNLIHIQYENQNLCPESFTFTGTMKRTPEYTHVYDQNILTSLKEKYDVTKISNRTINTGFVAKGCVGIIEEIIMSKICFIEVNGISYRGFCTSQKVTDIDTSAEFMQFDLDFLLLE